MKSKPNSKYPGRMIVVTLSFPNQSNRKSDTFSKKAKGNVKLFICSAYHPYEHAEQIKFYDELDSFLTNRPRNLELLLGADVNSNVGIQSTMFQDVIGPNGLSNRNLKGKDLLYLLKSNQCKILLSYYTHNNYITYRTFRESKYQHMLDNFICSDKFLKRVTD